MGIRQSLLTIAVSCTMPNTTTLINDHSNSSSIHPLTIPKIPTFAPAAVSKSRGSSHQTTALEYEVPTIAPRALYDADDSTSPSVIDVERCVFNSDGTKECAASKITKTAELATTFMTSTAPTGVTIPTAPVSAVPHGYQGGDPAWTFFTRPGMTADDAMCRSYGKALECYGRLRQGNIYHQGPIEFHYVRNNVFSNCNQAKCFNRAYPKGWPFKKWENNGTGFACAHATTEDYKDSKIRCWLTADRAEPAYVRIPINLASRCYRNATECPHIRYHSKIGH